MSKLKLKTCLRRAVSCPVLGEHPKEHGTCREHGKHRASPAVLGSSLSSHRCSRFGRGVLKSLAPPEAGGRGQCPCGWAEGCEWHLSFVSCVAEQWRVRTPVGVRSEAACCFPAHGVQMLGTCQGWIQMEPACPWPALTA